VIAGNAAWAAISVLAGNLAPAEVRVPARPSSKAPRLTSSQRGEPVLGEGRGDEMLKPGP
jgi:hypothetical protein